MNLNRKISIETLCKSYLGDLHTPIGIYLRLRDKYLDTILLESAGNQSEKNSFSFICINAIAGIEVKKSNQIEIKFPNENPQTFNLKNEKLTDVLNNFSKCFIPKTSQNPLYSVAQGFYGYTGFGAVEFFSGIKLKKTSIETQIPVMRYRLYQYVIAINHSNDEMTILENKINGLDSDIYNLEALINRRATTIFPFKIKGSEKSNLSDSEMSELVEIAKNHAKRGDVFQLVLSRRFQQEFQGDEFNVYRSLRNINPSPYLFYFDYGDYKIFGSSPESQLIIKNGKAIIRPIAGTFKRTGDVMNDFAPCCA